MVAAGAGVFEAPPNRGFCSAGLDAALPNNPPPPVDAGVELVLVFALPKGKLGVPAACPKRLVVAAGFAEDPNKEPEAGAEDVVALFACPAVLEGVPKEKDMMC